MRPHSLRRIAGKTSRVQTKMLRRLTLIISSHISSDMSRERATGANPGVVTQDVDVSERLRDGCKRGFALCLVTHVRFGRRGPHAEALDLIGGRLGAFPILVDDANVSSLGGEYTGDSAPNAASTAGDQRYSAARTRLLSVARR